MSATNIIIAGVGGQGNIAASKIIGEAALMLGYDVKITETHGMAQRGGSVHSMVRFGDKVFSPLIPKGACQYLLSLEILEGLRWVEYLKDGAFLIVSTEIRPPYSVSVGKDHYPQNIEEIYSKYGQLLMVPAKELASKAGSTRSANIVMLGCLAYLTKSINSEAWIESIKRRFYGKEKVIEINLNAFQLGYEFASNSDRGR
ncbi:MAG: indolepyruvate oxidoreductase subunit beta [Actinobacteria bacterium]|nr:indolepyruvate oxidoreductase subunit beta [Actinomycetota bacterium]